MFSRFLGRSAAPVNEKAAKDVGPEEDDNQTEINNQEISLDEIKVDVVEERPEVIEHVKVDDSVSQIPALSSSWIVSENKAEVWPAALEEVFPSELVKKIESRKCPAKPLDEKMFEATTRRDYLLSERVQKLYQHNQDASHLVLSTTDLKITELRSQNENSMSKIINATERRELHLNGIRCNANLAPVSTTEDLDTNSIIDKDDIRRSRMEVAIRVKSAILKNISERAARRSEHARLVASELVYAEEETSQILAQQCEEKLRRADVRRQIFLDQKILACARHANYVQSVCLTKRYMGRRNAQMIQHSLEAAAFRRDVSLEEIKSKCRQQNLRAQFRACCAYRLSDARWLNTKLKTTASQTAARIRRDDFMEELQQRMHNAEMRRRDVFTTRYLIITEKTDAKYSNAKMQAATHRREMHLYERSKIITQRKAIIRGRKSAIFTMKRRQGRKALENKLNEATMRRNAFIEARRTACSIKNWHARVVVDRQTEVNEETKAIGESQLLGRMEAAEIRRENYIFPIFSKLMALRGVRSQQILLDRQEYNREFLDRKNAFDRVRLAALNQNNMNQAFDRLSRTKQVVNNRQFMDTFYQQVISNTTMARQRGAELRRALYQDAVVASASETLDRSLQARQRLEFYNEEAKELHEIKMSNAEIRRMKYLNEKVGTALWFQGKVAVANQLNVERSEALCKNIAEAAASARLRRSIYLTQSVQKNAIRALRWQTSQSRQQMLNEEHREELVMKAKNAEIRRNSHLLHKQEIAKCTSNRVAVARIEKRAEDVVDAAILTAMMKTMGRNAEERRAEQLEEVQHRAASQFSHAKGVARYQKELQQVRAFVTLEESKLRMLETTKRRNNLMSQRKLGHSTIDQLQPYAGLTIIGSAMIPSSA